MATINGCNIPEDLYYLAGDKLVWARFEADGTVTAGVPDPGQAIAGKVVAVTPKCSSMTIFGKRYLPLDGMLTLKTSDSVAAKMTIMPS